MKNANIHLRDNQIVLTTITFKKYLIKYVKRCFFTIEMFLYRKKKFTNKMIEILFEKRKTKKLWRGCI